MKVFVSSTCHDLIDVRAELAQVLIEMGVQHVMSDMPILNIVFAELTVNSIATCLANVQSSDIVLVVLSQRYGPSLPASISP